MKIAVINGPNLNLLGTREPDIYGNTTLKDIQDTLQQNFPEVSFTFFQSNVEGELINQLHASINMDGVVINAGGYSHTSVAIADAVASLTCTVISVHISNIYKREVERHTDLISKYASGGVFGLGILGYELAVRSLVTNRKSL